jgi:hypothetical protein
VPISEEGAKALRSLKKLLDGYQKANPIRFALTGQGTGAATSDVDGKPGWAWVRYDELQSKVSQVRNKKFPGIPEGVPVVIGKLYPTDKYVQILGISESLYGEHYTDDTLGGYLVPPHGQTHNSQASDPAPIDLGNLVPGLVHQTDPDSTSVIVESFRYMNNLSVEKFDRNSVDLSGSEPTTGYHRYTLISVTPSSGTARATDGDQVTTPAIPDVPSVPAGDIPLAVVDVKNSTDITNNDIYDYRVVFRDAGRNVQEALRQLALVESELDFALTTHVVG